MAAGNGSGSGRIAAAVIAALLLLALALWSVAGPEPRELPAERVMHATDALPQQQPLPRIAPRSEPAPEPLQPAETVTAAEPARQEPHAAAVEPVAAELVDIRIVVVDQSARPVPDATVVTRPRNAVPGRRLPWGARRAPGPDPSPGPTWATDALGRCVVRIAPSNDFVMASKPGVGRSDWVNSILLARARNDAGDAVVVLEPVFEVRGVVLTAEGFPAPQVPVHVAATRQFLGIGGNLAETLSATPDGSFRLSFLPPDGFRIVAATDDGRTAEHLVEKSTDTVLDLTLRLSGDWWIDGVVLDAQGAPRGAATVRVLPAADLHAPWDSLQNQADRSRWEMCATQDDGSFSYRAKSLTPHVLVATGDVSAPTEPVRVDLDVSLPRAHVVLQLPSPAEIAGRLRAEDGTPVAQATAILIEREPTWLRAVPSGAQWMIGLDSNVFAGRSSTDTEGRFRIGGLHPRGTYDVLALPPGQGRFVQAETLAEGVPAGTQDLDLVARSTESARTGIIRATVRSAVTGEPVKVSAYSWAEEGKVAGSARGASQDDNGQVVIEGLVPGQTYTLSVSSKGLAAVDVHDVIAREDPEPIAIDLPATTALLVEVTDAHGLALPYVEVSVKRSYDGAAHHHPRPRFTDERGQVRFDEMDPGSYRVSFEREGVATEASVDVYSGTTGHLILATEAN